jgi:hypothetical protein
MKENKNWKGKYVIQVKKNGEIIKEDVIYNRILDTALNQMANALYDGSNDCVIKYLGLGTQTASTLNTCTSLGSETFRTYRASSTISNTGEVENVFSVGVAEAKFLIKEIGIYAGSTATGTVSTGILMSTISWVWDKSSVDEEILITRYDSFNRSTKIR